MKDYNNKKRIINLKSGFKRFDMHPDYIASLLKKEYKISRDEIKSIPKLMERAKINLTLKRKIRNYKLNIKQL